MKKTLYILGIACTSLMLLGSLFKVLHYPGATILLVVSILAFCVLFLPFALINNYRNSDYKGRLPLYIVSFISGFIVLLGALFKIQHWPGASWFLVVGVPLPFILFLPVYLYYDLKERSKSNSNIIYIMLVMVFIAVFSVLLSLRVSKNVLDAEHVVENRLDHLRDFYTQKSAKLLDDIITNDSLNREYAVLIHNQSDAISAYINETKDMIIKAQSLENVNKLRKADNVSLNELIDKTDMHHAKVVLGVHTHGGRATVLKEKINVFKEETKKIIDRGIYNDLVDAILETEGEKYYKDGELVYEWNWEQKKFAYLSAISIFNILTSIENDVRMAEYEALSCLKNKDLLARFDAD